MAKNLIQFTLRSFVCALPLAIATVALADNNLFAPPPDPTAMAPMQVAPDQKPNVQSGTPTTTESLPIPRRGEPNMVDPRLFNAPMDPLAMAPMQAAAEEKPNPRAVESLPPTTANSL